MLKRIALDLDGVTYKWSATACFLLNKYKGYNLKHEDVDNWDWIESHVSKNDWKWLWGEGIKAGLFRYGHCFKGAIEGIKELSELSQIVIVTSRPKVATQDTLDWLSFLRIPFSEIHVLGSHQNKSDIRPMFDLAIDDSPKQIQYYVEAGIPTVVFAAKYNKETHGMKGVHVADGWDEVVKVTKGLLNGGQV